MKFVLKWILNGVIVTLLLMYFANLTVWTAFITASLLTIIAYFLGDQFILRASNNAVATLSDGVLAIVFLWIAASWMDWPLTFGEILIISAVLAVAEWFLHRFLFHEHSYAI